jgi:hypothetical protein
MLAISGARPARFSIADRFEQASAGEWLLQEGRVRVFPAVIPLGNILVERPFLRMTDIELIEQSFQIAWGVLERTGELGEPN